ncbi:MAG: hypothetical protein ACR2RE_02015, partial [Geminicoccaceae bacterium]
EFRWAKNDASSPYSCHHYRSVSYLQPWSEFREQRHTACWSKSKIGKQHPYYLCHSKNCTSYRKSIRHDVLEGKFSDTLRALQPTESLFDTAKATFKDIWTQRQAQIGSMRSQLNQEAAEIDQ